jgi:lysophospholipase L1-like esterase
MKAGQLSIPAFAAIAAACGYLAWGSPALHNPIVPRPPSAVDPSITSSIAPKNPAPASSDQKLSAIRQAAYTPVAPTSVRPDPSAEAKAGSAEPIPVAVSLADLDGMAPTVATKDGLAILHIGDSHTSADFFTGELRQRLQQRYGKGGTGYMTSGRPHIGVRSSTLKITPSSGWKYKSLQKPDADPEKFWLSGYDSIATTQGQTLLFASERPISYSNIEIEAVRQPGGGAIDIRLDGRVEKHYDLAAKRAEPVVISIPSHGLNTEVREVLITTTGQGEVLIGSVSIYNNRSGLTYNSVGYVGATVGVLNKLTDSAFASSLKRINPRIVVLSFGTNEAADDDLDIVKYTKSYEQVLKKIKAALPRVTMIVISPPDFSESSPGCSKEQKASAICRSREDAPVKMVEAWTVASAATAFAPTSKPQCLWRTPTKLAQVRDAQRDIAKRYGLIYWNWGSIMPSECGAHQWYSMSPPLMSADHVHFTAEGYKRSAQQFLNVLIPVIDSLQLSRNSK